MRTQCCVGWPPPPSQRTWNPVKKEKDWDMICMQWSRGKERRNIQEKHVLQSGNRLPGVQLSSSHPYPTGTGCQSCQCLWRLPSKHHSTACWCDQWASRHLYPWAAKQNVTQLAWEKWNYPLNPNQTMSWVSIQYLAHWLAQAWASYAAC